MEYFMNLLSIEDLDYGVYRYAAAFGAIFLGFLLKRLTVFISTKLKKVTEKTEFRYDDILIESLIAPIGWAFLILGVYLATLFLPIPDEPVNFRFFVSALVRSATAIIIIWIIAGLIDRLTQLWSEKATETDTRLDDQFIPIVRSASRVFFVLIGVVLVLQNLGYSVTSLVAGFGLGGAAVALASKDSLSNLFGSIVIFLDRPFQIGDWIEIGPIEGTVEEVGLRTTKIRTFPNSLITMPNAMLTTTAINNWSRMKKRRIKTTIGITYDAAPDRIEAAVQSIKDVILNDPKIRNDFFLVNFAGFGESSLEIFIYCFTVTTNWAEYMDAKQEFFLAIMKRFRELGLEFAFPTRTVHLAPGAYDALEPGREYPE